MTVDATVRHANPADASAIAACYRDAYRVGAKQGYPTRMTDIDAETVADWLDADAVTLVAEPAGTATDDATARTSPIVGTVRLLERRAEPYLERLAVVESWQGNGIGRRLVGRIEQHARTRGYDCIQLTTYDDHPFLYDWYVDRGYEPIETHEKPARPYDYVTMERQFDSDSGR